MAHETELKFRISPEHLERIANVLTLSAPERQVDSIFLYGTNSFMDFTPGSPVVRLRRQGASSVLTVKRAVDGSTSHEVEMAVADPASCLEIIEALGFKPVTTVSKTRAVASLRGVSVCVDKVDTLGLFIELESCEREPALAMHRILQVRELLGLDSCSVEKKKYDQLVTEARNDLKACRSEIDE